MASSEQTITSTVGMSASTAVLPQEEAHTLPPATSTEAVPMRSTQALEQFIRSIRGRPRIALAVVGSALAALVTGGVFAVAVQGPREAGAAETPSPTTVASIMEPTATPGPPTISVSTPRPSPSGQATPEQTASPGPARIQAPGAPAPATTATQTPPALPTRAPPILAGDPVFHAWAGLSSDGSVVTQVVLPVTNVSDRWVELCPVASTYRALDDAGIVRLSSAHFEHAAPNLLGPGGTGYLMIDVGHPQDDPREYVDRIEATVAFGEVDVYEDLARIVANWPTVSAVETSRGPYGGITVTGRVNNPGESVIEQAAIIAILLDADGRSLGFAYGPVDSLDPASVEQFRADAYLSDIALDDIAETLVFVSDGAFRCEGHASGG
jgi:hypothetical protein